MRLAQFTLALALTLTIARPASAEYDVASDSSAVLVASETHYGQVDLGSPFARGGSKRRGKSYFGEWYGGYTIFFSILADAIAMGLLTIDHRAPFYAAFVIASLAAPGVHVAHGNYARAGIVATAHWVPIAVGLKHHAATSEALFHLDLFLALVSVPIVQLLDAALLAWEPDPGFSFFAAPTAAPPGSAYAGTGMVFGIGGEF